MQITKAEKFRLGVFVVLSITLLAGTLFYLMGKHLLTQEDPYYVRFSESVDGLLKAANVKLNGVVVGRVTAMEVDPNDVKKTIVRFVVKRGTPIKKDMAANLSGGLSITGLKGIEITGGDQNSPDIPVGGEIPAGVSQIKILTGQAEAIALKFETLINNLLVFTGDENQARTANMLQGFSDLSKTVDELLVNNKKSLEDLPQKLNESLTLFNQITLRTDSIVKEIRVARIGAKVSNTMNDFEKTSKLIHKKVEEADLNKTLNELQKASKNIGDAAGNLNNTLNVMREDLTTSMRFVRDASENLADFSRMIRENPSLLLKSEEKQERGR